MRVEVHKKFLTSFLTLISQRIRMRELLTIIRSAQHFLRLQDFLIHVTVIVPLLKSMPIWQPRKKSRELGNL